MFQLCIVYIQYMICLSVEYRSRFSPNRCRDSEDTDSYLPCSLSLFNVYLQYIQKEYSGAIKVSVISSNTSKEQKYFIISFILLYYNYYWMITYDAAYVLNT